MVKSSICSRLRARILQLRVVTLVGYVLIIITIVQFFCYGVYNYEAIPLSSIEKELYKATVPKLVHLEDKPLCSYQEVFSRNESVPHLKVPTEIDNFSPQNITNGSYMPTDCNPQISVAILVTYRNRQRQLNIFLPYIHNFLRKQNIHYKIFLIEQQDEKPWNKGALYNIGAKYAMAEKFPCLILHDVDLLPLDAGNLYACLNSGPRHLSASIDKMRFVLIYWWLVGGVLAIKSEHFTIVNGFSNRYEGWGGEDDDFYERLASEGLQVLRLPRQVSRYHMVPHSPLPVNKEVWNILAKNKQEGRPGWSLDGLSTVQYTGLKVVPHRLFTLIGVRL